MNLWCNCSFFQRKYFICFIIMHYISYSKVFSSASTLSSPTCTVLSNLEKSNFTQSNSLKLSRAHELSTTDSASHESRNGINASRIFMLNETRIYKILRMKLNSVASTVNQFLENVLSLIMFPKKGHCKCGIPNVRGVQPVDVKNYTGHRIVGGKETKPNEYPWMAAIFVRKGIQKYHICAGSLINNYIVMTAGHCVKSFADYPQYLLVDLADHDLFSDLESPHIYKAVSRVLIHPKYNVTYVVDFDVALLVLSSFVDIYRNPRILPVCLPYANTSKTYENEEAFILGWGKLKYDEAEKSPGVLYGVNVKIFNDKVCKRAYEDKYPQTAICAGDEKGGKDSCQGDSGGPLMVRKKNRFVQIGIVSFGRRCADKDYPGVYTRVSSVMDFINTHFRNAASHVRWCR